MNTKKREWKIGKLNLQPGDIVLVTVPVGIHLKKIHDQVAKLIKGNKIVVIQEGITIEKLAGFISIEDLSELLKAKENKLLQIPTVPAQVAESPLAKGATRFKDPNRR